MKTPSTVSRWSLYGLALGATLLAGSWAGGQDDDAAPVPARVGAAAEAGAASRAQERAATETPAIDLAALGARTLQKSSRDLFPSTSWDQLARAEAAKRAPPPPPPRPQAPALPFTYMGKMVDNGRTTVFLVHGDRNLVVHEGDTVQGTYKVESIGESELTLTYLPLKQRQSLALTAASAPGSARSTVPVSPEAPQAPPPAAVDQDAPGEQK
jgi:hypothetical protein